MTVTTATEKNMSRSALSLLYNSIVLEQAWEKKLCWKM